MSTIDRKIEDRARVGTSTSIVGIVCNIALFVAKLFLGIVTGALSITADAINNFSDASASIITLWGFKAAKKPADAEHPYGHGRSEYIAGMVVAAMILFIGFEVGKTAVSRILKPVSISFSQVLVLVLLLSILVKMLLGVFYQRRGKKIESATLRAAAMDSWNDVITTTSVLIAAVVEYKTNYRLDGYISLAVSLFILYSGVKMVKETIDPLLGHAGSKELRRAIAAVVCSKEEVLGYHDLLVHDYGPNQCFASIHVELDHQVEAIHCHDLIDEIERTCLAELNVHLVIHYDPIVTDDARLKEMQEQVQEMLIAIDGRLLLHDFRLVEEKGEKKLVFDVSVPDDLLKRTEEIQTFLEEKLDVYDIVITFDPLT